MLPRAAKADDIASRGPLRAARAGWPPEESSHGCGDARTAVGRDAASLLLDDTSEKAKETLGVVTVVHRRRPEIFIFGNAALL